MIQMVLQLNTGTINFRSYFGTLVWSMCIFASRAFVCAFDSHISLSIMILIWKLNLSIPHSTLYRHVPSATQGREFAFLTPPSATFVASFLLTVISMSLFIFMQWKILPTNTVVFVCSKGQVPWLHIKIEFGSILPAIQVWLQVVWGMYYPV